MRSGLFASRLIPFRPVATRLALPLFAFALLLGMLSLGAASVPAAAQAVSTVSASTQPARQTQPEDADPNDVYRHSATVRWIAHTFHTSTESAARTFEWINFAILALAIVIPLWRILPGVLRRRSQALRQQFDSTREATEQAHQKLTAIEAQLGDLGGQIDAIRRQVAMEMEADEARYRSAVQEESARILASANLEIESASLQAQRELRAFAGQLAIEKALAGLTVTEEQDRVLMDEFVRGTGNEGRN